MKTESEFIIAYIARAKLIFDREIEIRTNTRIHDLSVQLGLTLEQVMAIWYREVQR